MPKAKIEPKLAYKLLVSGKIDELENYANNHIDLLGKTIEAAKIEQEVLMTLLRLAEIYAGITRKNAALSKKGKLRFEWKETIKDCWHSEAGSVNRKAWGKYEGWPKCLEHLRSDAEDDRSYNNMVHRPKRYSFEQRRETIDFDTLIDCQLAVEEAHFKSLK